MKIIQQQNAWILQMLMYETGRRRQLPPQAGRRRFAFRRNDAMKLAVTFTPEEPSAFTPVIRTAP